MSYGNEFKDLDEMNVFWEKYKILKDINQQSSLKKKLTSWIARYPLKKLNLY